MPKTNKALRVYLATALAFGWTLAVGATSAFAEEPAAPTEPVVVVVTTEGGDDSSYQVPLTTTITFDGVEYTEVFATTNSVITFGRADGTYWDYPQTPSISLYSMDWVVYPNQRADEYLTISSSDGGFQVDISARPIWLQNAIEPTNINIVAAINVDGTVAISYSLTGPSYEGSTRTGVRLTSGQVVTLEEYGVIQVEEPPVLTPEPVVPTDEPTASPEPTPTPSPTTEPTPTQEPTPTPTPEVTTSPEPTPSPEPTTQPTPQPFVPEGATVISEGTSIEVVAPAGQRIVSITAWYGDPNDSTRGVDVSSTLTELASGQTSVTINSDNRYGDPAGGTVKVLIFLVSYEAAGPTPEEIAAAEREERERQERLAAEQAAAEAARVEEQARLAAAEAARVAAEQAAIAEAARLEAERLAAEQAAEAARLEAERVAAEAAAAAEASRLEAERLAAEQAAAEAKAEEARLQAERLAAEQAAKAEADRLAAEAEALKPEPIPEEPVNELPEKPVVEEITSAEELPEVISAELLTKIDLTEIVATDLSPQQAEALKDAALETFETAEAGSAEYEQALDALFVAAAADDIVLSAELAAIPGAQALADTLNFMSNVGADMSPQQREESEKVVVAAVVAGNAAIAAATTSAAAAAAPSAGGAGRRIK